MPVVQLPDGTGVEFPEGTDPGVMRDAMRKHWWKHNDAILAKEKAKPVALPEQGQEFSPAGTGQRGISIPTTTGLMQLPSREEVGNFFAGAGRRADSILNRGAQVLNPTDEAVQRGVSQIEAEKDRRDAPLTNTAAGKTGEIATDAALTALPATKVVKGAAAFATPLARTIATLTGAGSVSGLYDAATKPVREGDTTAENALEGFGWGAGGQAVGSAGGRIIKGVVPAVKKAIDPITGRVKSMYDKATLGQIADKETNTGRIVNATEEGVGSIPLIGSVIRNRRKAGVDEWRNQILDQVRPPGSAKGAGTVADRISGMQQEYGTAYDDALAGHEITPDANFRAKVFQRAMDPSTGLPPDARKGLAQNIDEQYTDLFKPRHGGALGPDEFYHGGEFSPISDGATLDRPLFGARYKPMADSYLDMHGARNGGDTGTATRRMTSPVKNPAPQQVVLDEAKAIGMPIDDYTPASVFDKNINDPAHVDELLRRLKAKGYDHTVMEDRPFGNFPAGEHPSDAEMARVIFPGTDVYPSTGSMAADATSLKAMESRLGKQARQRGISLTPDGPAQGELTGAIRDDLRRSYRSQLPRATGARLQELDQSYAPFKTVERAATATGNQEGQFTPPQLLQAVKARTAAPEFAARQGMLQEEADTGKQVFQNRLSDSGTIERGLLAGGAFGGAAFLHPSSLALPAASFAGTTKSGRNFGIGATRVQLLLKKLRADELARNSGVGLSQSVEDLLEQ